MALSFPALTEMFHFSASGFPGCPGIMGFSSHGVSPFGNPRVKACSAAHRGISQLAASFVASRSQGILHVPLVACPHILEHQYGKSQTLSAGFAFVLSPEHGLFSPCQTFPIVTEPGRQRPGGLIRTAPNRADRQQYDNFSCVRKNLACPRLSVYGSRHAAPR